MRLHTFYVLLKSLLCKIQNTIDNIDYLILPPAIVKTELCSKRKLYYGCRTAAKRGTASSVKDTRQIKKSITYSAVEYSVYIHSPNHNFNMWIAQSTKPITPVG